MPRHAAITIGNFDGVHRGHCELVRAARRHVGESGQVIVLCFDPHPATVLRPKAAPARLSTIHQRRRWLSQAGADEVDVLRPTPQFLDQSPEQFIAALVAERAPAYIVEGPDFRFGKRRMGTIETLRSCEASYGYRTVVVEQVQACLTDQSIVRVSSSFVRWLVRLGRVNDAQRLLGRPYTLTGEVVWGDQRGRDIGVPTANLDPGELLLPADGIYSGLATLADGSQFPAAISVGTKPTFGHSPRTCEAHLIGFNGQLDVYGWPLELQFINWVRDQLTYASVDALIEQLARDIQRCEKDVSNWRSAQSANIEHAQVQSEDAFTRFAESSDRPVLS